MRESGCDGHYEFALVAGAKAKTVTNNLPLLSVLGFRSYIFVMIYNIIFAQKLLFMQSDH
jgi:hypothetical protein